MNAEDQAKLALYIKQLNDSARGRNAMNGLLAWLDNYGLGLDEFNQRAVIQLLLLAWKHPGSTRDAMREAIGGDA